MKRLSIYIHIPFCVKKCDYCDFLSAPATRERQAAYVVALCAQIKASSVSYKDYSVYTVFFGGGTPSLLETGYIEMIMGTLRGNYNMEPDAEITIEMNPGTVTNEKLACYKAMGINRLSIGLQSADDGELKTIGRIHTFGQFLETYKMSRQAGFDNINIDLMSALPGQDLASWSDTLKKVIGLTPEHISAYSLIIEEGTKLYGDLNNYPTIPDEDEDRMMYRETKRIMEEYGYKRYEISNYAKPGYECRHNIVYWERGNYVGFGLGASSLVEDVRWKNTSDMNLYLAGAGYPKEILCDIETLDQKACMGEYMFLGLRMMCGVSKAGFEDRFGVAMDDVFKEALGKWTDMGMIVNNGDYYMLSEKGIDISNVIMADFILGD